MRFDDYFYKKNLFDTKDKNPKPNKPESLVDKQKVEMYILANRRYFPSNKIIYLRSKLCELDAKKFEMISIIKLKSPFVIQIISTFLGFSGLDRFIIGDIGMGFLKLFTLGFCGTFWLYDSFTIIERVKKLNFESIILLT